MHAKKTHTPEEIKKGWEHYCTVGQLKKILEEKNVPDDAKILIQRVEDVYFEEYNWGTVKKKGDTYYSEKRLIDKAKPGGEFHDKEQYPNINEEIIKNILDSEKDLDELKDEYVPAWWPIKYDDDDNIYLCAFY